MNTNGTALRFAVWAIVLLSALAAATGLAVPDLYGEGALVPAVEPGLTVAYGAIAAGGTVMSVWVLRHCR